MDDGAAEDRGEQQQQRPAEGHPPDGEHPGHPQLLPSHPRPSVPHRHHQVVCAGTVNENTNVGSGDVVVLQLLLK